jgi:damage-control phosphatase, subfamily I
MRIYLDCVPCFIRQALDAARHATDDELMHEVVVRKVAELIKELDMTKPPPAIGQRIHRLVREMINVEDPYHRFKQRFNDAALSRYSNLREIIANSANCIEAAVRIAIAGNIIDFGVKSNLEESELFETIQECLAEQNTSMQLNDFIEEVNKAEDILFLADNAGEIVFDRLLIERLPVEKITVAVKGYPVINDATMEDAIRAGLPQIVDVIDNGSDAPGTILESCSQSFRNRFEKADMIIAKGQGNYESLSNIDKNVFFMLKAKCPVIASDIGCNMGEMVLLRRSSSMVTTID